jgi:hypothetical protein
VARVEFAAENVVVEGVLGSDLLADLLVDMADLRTEVAEDEVPEIASLVVLDRVADEEAVPCVRNSGDDGDARGV